MKSKIILWICVLVLLVSSVSALGTTGIVSVYKLSNATDAIGTNDLENNGATFVPGKIDNAADFDGISDEMNNETAILNITTDFSMNFWMRRETSAGIMDMYAFGDLDGAGGYNNNLLIIRGNADNTIDIFGNNAGSVICPTISTSALPDGNFHMITYTNDGSGLCRIYVNGTEVDNATSNNEDITLFEDISLGVNNNNGNFYDGVIDEAYWWNTVLTGSNVTELFNNGSGFQYPFIGPAPAVNISGPSLTVPVINPQNPNQSSNLTANSTYTNDDNASIIIEKVSGLNITNVGAISVDGEFGQAFQFDGVDDYLNFTTANTFQNVTLFQMSWSWWMNSTGQSADARAINRKWSEPDDERSWFIETQGASGDGVRIRLSANGVTSAQTLDTSFFINDGEWHYYAITFNGSLGGDNLMFYVDGALNSNNTNSRTNLFSNVDVPILIGDSENLSDPLDAGLDEMRIWKIALTPEEINETRDDNESVALDDLIMYMDFDYARGNVTTIWRQNGVINQTETVINARNNTQVNSSYFCPDFDCSNGDLINVSFNVVDIFGNNTNVSDQVEINNTGTVNISALEKVSGLNINIFNITLPQIRGTTTGNITFIEEATTINVTGTAPTYLNTVSNNSETVLFDNITQVVLSDFYSSNITLNVTDLLNGSIITGFNWTVISNNFSFSESGTSDTIGLINGSFNITVAHPIYLDNRTTFTINSDAQTLNIQLFITNTFNITIRYELDRSIVDDRNVTLQFVSTLEAFNRTTGNGTLFISMIQPSIVDIRYASSGFRERSFFFNLENKSANNITLYMLDNTNGTLVIITNVDETGTPIERFTTQVLRGFIIGGQEVFEVVEMDMTDFAGEAVFTLQLNDVRYIVRTVRNVSTNEIVFLSNPFEITGTTLRVTLDLLADPLESFNSWRGITFTGPTFDNTSQNWTATYNDVPGLINPGGIVCLEVFEQIGVDRRPFSEACASTSIATLTIQYTGSHGTFAQIVADTNTENSIYVLSVAENLIDARSAVAAALGGSGAFWSAAIIYGISTILIFNPATYMYGLIGGLVSVWLIGFTSTTWGGIVALIIMGGVLIAKLKT